MLYLPQSLHAWGLPDFTATLTNELTALAGQLPVDRCATPGSHVESGSLSLTVLAHAEEQPATIRVSVGVFFTEIVASCGCGDEPFAHPGYGELNLHIDRATGAATASVKGE